MNNREHVFLMEKEITYANLENVFTNERHYRAMKGLSDIEKYILYKMMVEEKRAYEVAKMMNITEETVMQIKTRAVRDFKKSVKRK